ncbi:isopeptide-forming domain-containing fimbrial protein [Butyrivibrio sp. JL13D10]|uniref:isopeptide-forming domain-containing fimbrial protein n=1 Tax=Butyrivibrio sp. JL13D10 TaxID=3236815 RepID=UPI0038B6125B
MKGLKKFLTGILAGAMALSMTLTAGNAMSAKAADITIDSTSEDSSQNTKQSYTWYRILSADISDDVTLEQGTNKITSGTVVYYTDTEARAKALQGTGLFDYTATADGKFNVYPNDAGKNASGELLAAKLDEIKESFESGTVNGDADGSTELGVGTDGYYLITSSLGSTLIAQTLGSNVHITEKNTYPTVDKKQSTTADNYSNEDLTVKVGDVIYYSIDVTIPAATSEEIFVRDTMSTGLSYNNDAVVTGYNGIALSGEDLKGATFGYKFAANNGSNASATITFSATVTADAVIASSKQNDVTLDYGEYHQEDTVKFLTYKTIVYKYGGAEESNKLEGVKFTLKANNVDFPVSYDATNKCYFPDANGSAEIVTDADGFIVIRGLSNVETTYTIYETETVAGYNLPAEADRTTPLALVEDNGGTYTPNKDADSAAKIRNNSGAVLPSTGGIGTTIFYIIGGLLIVAAVVFFVVRRKSDAE